MLLTNDTSGAPYSKTVHDTNNAILEGGLADLGPYVISGLVPSAGTGFAVNVTAGVASLGGRLTMIAFSITGLTPSTTNHLFLKNDSTGTSNTSGTPPANSVKLGTALTDGSGVLSVDTTTASGRQTRLVVPQGALIQTYAVADATLSAYTSDPESGAYTGIDNLQAGTVYATVADLNQLRVAYETLRVFSEDLAAFTNSLVDKLQSAGIIG